MGISVVDSAFSGFTGASATESVTVPAGAQAGDTLIAVISRRAALVEDMSAWTLQTSQQASDENLPSIQQWVDIYTKPFNGDSTVSVEFTATNTRNSLTLIVARTSAGSIEVVWSDSFAEYSGSGGTIEDSHHRFPYRADAASTEQLVIKASTCKYAQTSATTFFDDTVSGSNNAWASQSNTEQHTPTSTLQNTTFVATEIVSAGSSMLDGSGVGQSVSNNAHARHVTGVHDGASITIVFADPADSDDYLETQIQLRSDVSSNWAAENPTLLSGEFGYEKDTNKIKIGNGLTAWNDLNYYDENFLQLVDAPASASASGEAGQVAYDSSYIYVCVATDTWVRAGLSTW